MFVSISHYISAPGLYEEVNYGVMEMLNGGNKTVDSDTILMIVFPEIFSFTPGIPHAL